jgi:hypothetical protein
MTLCCRVLIAVRVLTTEVGRVRFVVDMRFSARYFEISILLGSREGPIDVDNPDSIE